MRRRIWGGMGGGGYDPVSGSTDSLFPGGGIRGPLPDQSGLPDQGPIPPIPAPGGPKPIPLPGGIDLGQITGSPDTLYGGQSPTPQGPKLSTPGMPLGSPLDSTGMTGMPGGPPPNSRDLIMQGLQRMFRR